MPSAVRVPRARSREDSAGVLPQRGRALVARLPAAGLLLLVIALSIVLVDVLKRRARDAEMFRVDPSRIELAAMSDGVPARIRDELVELLRIEPRTIFDPALVEDVRAALVRHPWVREVREVRRILPNRLAVDVALRTPAAIVDVGRWRVTVDREGRVLEDQSALAPDGLPRIRGDLKAVPAIPEVGGRFHARAVQDGLSVAADLRRLADHPFLRLVGIEAVDVRNVGSTASSEIVLELASGTLVEWGSAATGALGPLEPDAAHKLDNLLLVHDRHPGLVGVARIHAATPSPFVTLAQ